MDTLRFFILFVVILSLSATGCFVETQTTETHILDSKIFGTSTQIPVHVTTPASPHTSTFSPYCSFGNQRTVRGIVEGSSPYLIRNLYPPDTVVGADGKKSLVRRIPANNLAWKLPAFAFGADWDYKGSATAMTMGANYSSLEGSTHCGFHGSVALFSARENGLGVRLETGLGVEEISSENSSVVITWKESQFLGWVTSRSVDTAYYRDKVRSFGMNYFASLTLNSTFSQSPVNVLIQGAYHSQNFFDYTPRERTTITPIFPGCDSRPSTTVSISSSFASVTPGIVISFSTRICLVVGARFLWPLSESFGEPTTLVLPFLRFQLTTDQLSERN